MPDKRVAQPVRDPGRRRTSSALRACHIYRLPHVDYRCVTIRGHVANRLWSEFKSGSIEVLILSHFALHLRRDTDMLSPRPASPSSHAPLTLCGPGFDGTFPVVGPTLFAAQFCFGSLPAPHKPQTTPERLITSPTVSLPTSSALLISFCAPSLSCSGQPAVHSSRDRSTPLFLACRGCDSRPIRSHALKRIKHRTVRGDIPSTGGRSETFAERYALTRDTPR